jgi:hypothetical protein
MDAIRSVDDQRGIFVNRKPHPWSVESVLPIIENDGNAVMKGEGSPRMADVMIRTMLMQAGQEYLGELHRHMPTSKALADLIYFWEALWADYAFWQQRWRYSTWVEQWETGKEALRKDVPAVEAFMAKTQPNWNKFMTEPFDVPEVLVFCSRSSGNLGGARNGFFGEIAGLKTFTSLYRQHQIPVFAADEYTGWVDLNKFKVVFVEGEIQTQESMSRLVDYAKAGGKVVLVGDPGRYTAGNVKQRDYLKTQIGDLPNVRQIAEPVSRDKSGSAFTGMSPCVFNEPELESILSWAGVERPAVVTSDNPLGFEVATRRSEDGKHVLVGVIRTWNGWYRDTLEQEEVLQDLFGFAKGEVTVNDLPAGQWQVRKFHRDPKDLGTFESQSGHITFETDEAEAAEVQLYELTWVE